MPACMTTQSMCYAFGDQRPLDSLGCVFRVPYLGATWGMSRWDFTHPIQLCWALQTSLPGALDFYSPLLPICESLMDLLSVGYPYTLTSRFCLESCPETDTGVLRAPVLYLVSVSGGLRTSHIRDFMWACCVVSVRTIFWHFCLHMVLYPLRYPWEPQIRLSTSSGEPTLYLEALKQALLSTIHCLSWLCVTVECV